MWKYKTCSEGLKGRQTYDCPYEWHDNINCKKPCNKIRKQVNRHVSRLNLPTCASLDLFICAVMPWISAGVVPSNDDWQSMLTSVSDSTAGGFAQPFFTSRLFSSALVRDDMAKLAWCMLLLFENESKVWAAVRSRHHRHWCRSEQTQVS